MDGKKNDPSLPEDAKLISNDVEVDLEILDEEDDSFMTGKVVPTDAGKVQLNHEGLFEEDLKEAELLVESHVNNNQQVEGLPYSHYDEKAEYDIQKYIEEMMPQYERSNKFTPKLIATVIGLLLVGITITLTWFFLFKPTEDGPTPEPMDLIGSSSELLTLMYQTNGVETLTKNNNLILEYFIEGLKKDFDLRDSLVYAKRYGLFYNAPTSLKIQKTYESGKTVIIDYLITTEVSSPLQRIAFITYNNENLIEEFLEYNTY